MAVDRTKILQEQSKANALPRTSHGNTAATNKGDGRTSQHENNATKDRQFLVRGIFAGKPVFLFIGRWYERLENSSDSHEFLPAGGQASGNLVHGRTIYDNRQPSYMEGSAPSGAGGASAKAMKEPTPALRRAPFLSTIISLIICLFLSGHTSSANEPAPGTSTLADELTKLERQCGFEAQTQNPVMSRLCALEEKLFGKQQSGAVMPRIEAVRRIATARMAVLQTSGTPPPAKEEREGISETAVTSRKPAGVSVRNLVPDPVGSAMQEASVSDRRNFQPDALPLMNAFPPSLLRKDDPDFASSADYYPEVYKASKNRIIRFKNMPIPVYIQPYPDRDFVNCVVRSFEAWETRTDGAVRFSQVDNSEAARIRVLWKHLGSKADNNGCLLGAHTILKYTNRGNGNLSLFSVGVVPVPLYVPRMGPKYVVPPQVVEVNLDLIMTKDYSIRYRCLQNIIAHELGHALGLLGHSPCQSDIMYPVTDEHSRMSKRDLNTLIKLYNTNKVDVPL